MLSASEVPTRSRPIDSIESVSRPGFCGTLYLHEDFCGQKKLHSVRISTISVVQQQHVTESKVNHLTKKTNMFFFYSDYWIPSDFLNFV